MITFRFESEDKKNGNMFVLPAPIGHFRTGHRLSAKALIIKLLMSMYSLAV